ncbi:hypothetical protein DPMN_000714 [Dreissena polymorpha]|uniref:Uncharacterized protein n=1 Tax=Dreissena polymorpha TaxID=45954 RepID=A0A9D4MHX0_DREPO|nr:hypothetical protein DPMN_000714 [Dreissena polymorpha]
MNLQDRGSCGHIKARWDSHDTCLACTGCTFNNKCAVCDLWAYDVWTKAGRRRTSISRKRNEPPSNVDYPVTPLVKDDQRFCQSLGTGQDGVVVSRSSSDLMTHTMHTGDIDRGTTGSMSDHMAAAILRSLSGDVTGHNMTGRSPVRSCHRSGPVMSPVRSPVNSHQLGLPPITPIAGQEELGLHHRRILLHPFRCRIHRLHQGVDIGHALLRRAVIIVTALISDHVVTHGDGIPKNLDLIAADPHLDSAADPDLDIAGNEDVGNVHVDSIGLTIRIVVHHRIPLWNRMFPCQICRFQR